MVGGKVCVYVYLPRSMDLLSKHPQALPHHVGTRKNVYFSMLMRGEFWEKWNWRLRGVFCKACGFVQIKNTELLCNVVLLDKKMCRLVSEENLEKSLSLYKSWLIDEICEKLMKGLKMTKSLKGGWWKRGSKGWKEKKIIYAFVRVESGVCLNQIPF